MSSERRGFVPFQKIHRGFNKDVRGKHLICIFDSSRRTLSDKNKWWSRVFQCEIKIQIRISSDVVWAFVVILWYTHHPKIIHYKIVCLSFNNHVSALRCSFVCICSYLFIYRTLAINIFGVYFDVVEDWESYEWVYDFCPFLIEMHFMYFHFEMRIFKKPQTVLRHWLCFFLQWLNTMYFD